ncbi:YdeI/OmpD-associated family protein [Cohnella nanjingensis]|nr:YdeI/OmpD-associated family protein [Cohnella nanjingensis]
MSYWRNCNKAAKGDCRRLQLHPGPSLDRDAEAKRFFDGLSYSNKGRFVLQIEGAKTAETRQRRIDKVISTLQEGHSQ